MSLVASLIAASVISYSAPDPEIPQPLQIENASSDFSIDKLYITPTTESADWGPNLLGNDDVMPGEVFTVTDIPPGLYNVRLVDDTGASCVLRNIDFEEDPNFSFTGSDCYST